jgi:hypothetical protein
LIGERLGRLAAAGRSRPAVIGLVSFVGAALLWLAPSAGVHVLVFCVATVLAIYSRARWGPLSWERCGRVGMLSAIVVGVTVPAFVGTAR